VHIRVELKIIGIKYIFILKLGWIGHKPMFADIPPLHVTPLPVSGAVHVILVEVGVADIAVVVGGPTFLVRILTVEPTRGGRVNPLCIAAILLKKSVLN